VSRRSFGTENAGRNLVSSANFERTQVKSNHPSWRNDLAGADTLCRATRRFSILIPSGRIYPSRVVATIPRSAGYRISLVWKLRKPPSPPFLLHRPSCIFAHYFAQPPFSRGILFAVEIACETRNAPHFYCCVRCRAMNHERGLPESVGK